MPGNTSDSSGDTPEPQLAEGSILSAYLEAHQAALVMVEGSFALSVHGQISVAGHTVPYHLIPDDGFLGKSSRWRKLDTAARLGLVQSRWNPAAQERLEAQLADCVRLVLARADNSYETIGQGKNRTQALSQALDNARSTCRSQQPIIQNEQTRYQGVISEQTGRVIEQVGTVVGAITGQRDLGGRLARDDDYEVTLKFTCR